MKAKQLIKYFTNLYDVLIISCQQQLAQAAICHLMRLPDTGCRDGKTRLFQLMPWWRHQMETFSALLAFCAGNSPVTGEFPEQTPVTQSFDVFFDLRLNKRLSKQSRRRWLKTPSRSLWRHSNATSATWMGRCAVMTVIYPKSCRRPFRRWHTYSVLYMVKFNKIDQQIIILVHQQPLYD